MQSFTTPPPSASASDLYCHSPFYIRADENGRPDTRLADLGDLQHSSVFHQEDAVDLSRSSIYNEIKAGNAALLSNNLQFRPHHMNFGSTTEMSSIGTGEFMMQHQKGTPSTMVASGGGSGGGGGGLGKGHFENWGESAIADNSQQTDTSTDIDTDDKNQFNSVQHGGQLAVDSMGKIGDQKILRRLAQNREAARKSRLRKKAYVQQLENSRLKLSQLEQELKRARQQVFSPQTTWES
ncbi:Basic-leucine zipper domain-containing protein [Cynara cardunculus var. scolymus]|uniref:Basic-leucine zipper domain-containing protein n=1 Tax=Cynara cardunculus var. scolymus TaxID=59895 RepID=A0A103XSY8_CYNCS|nr:Basic-leucine zipper domain-containing protein [Cynara cardunculus var. scolymus]